MGFVKDIAPFAAGAAFGGLPGALIAGKVAGKLGGKKSPEELRAKASMIETKRGIPGGQPIESGSMIGDYARRRGMLR